ncbi:MAG: SDR family oxidoreductase [Candidatus Hadarchaeales archaeon]
MRILVTGGAGFIGSHTVDLLLSQGYEVTVLDDFSSGKRENLAVHLEKPSFKLVRGDIRDSEAVGKAMEGVEAVIHEAALVSVPLSFERPERVREINVMGTLHLLEACARKGVRRFIYASSASVYGEPKHLPVAEDHPPSPLSPYAESKLRAEWECLRFFRERGLETVCLRYFNVYGPRQGGGEYAGVIVRFLERLKKDLPPLIHGTGEQTRDFVYVGDVARANLLALISPRAPGQVLNIGTGRETSILELCSLLLKLTGKEGMKPIHGSPRRGDIKRSVADVRKAKEVLGFEAKTTLEEGLKEVLRFWHR